jgi:hypothetical protein
MIKQFLIQSVANGFPKTQFLLYSTFEAFQLSLLDFL